MELYKKYRPKDFKDVIGQEHVVKPLQKMIEKDNVPHAILLCGPKGCGKTTLGRIIRKKLKCSKWDFSEANCANNRGIDFIRSIERTANLAPMKGETKVWLLDESHMLTGESQDAALKCLEDTPSHVYFILATTDPQKLKKTVRSRCTEYPIRAFDSASLRTLIKKVCKGEKKKLSEEVEDKIITTSDNSARNALVLLEKVLVLSDEEDQLETISKSSSEMAAIQIARALFDPRTKWADMATILKATETEEPESIRYLILSYARTVLLGGGKNAGRAFTVLSIFRDDFYSCKKAGLAMCCYEVIVGS
jgi:DNA polymerase-3 subunit gamma/tau